MFYTLNEAIGIRNKFGNKAENLVELLSLNLNVPDAILLPALKEISFLDLTTLSNELDVILPSPDGWAVRSSSFVEDSKQQSYAGKFATIMISKSDQLPQAVKEVLQSNDADQPMGVIIQKWIEPDYAGVVFSCDPITMHEGMMLEIVKGRGEKLVSGLVTPHLYKEDRWINGSVDIPRSLIEEINQTILHIKSKFGFHVDMEFCIKNDKLFWLQVRPVTQLNGNQISSGQEMQGEWYLLDQCTEPVTPLIQRLDPAGFFNMSLWNTVFIDHYPYLQMKELNKSANENSSTDVWDEWLEIRSKFEPKFDLFLKEDLTTKTQQELWNITLDRIKVYQEFVIRYMDRSWMMIRRKTGKALKKWIAQALGSNVSLDIELSKLTTGLQTITAVKTRRLNDLVQFAKQLPNPIDLLDQLDFQVDHPWTKRFNEFIQDYGYEIPNPVALHLPTLGEKPEELLNKIKGLIQYQCKSSVDENTEWEIQANNIQSMLSEKDREDFQSKLKLYRHCLLRTENDDDLLQKGAASIRYSLVELSQCLVHTKQLRKIDHLFMLLPKEVELLINQQSEFQSQEVINQRLKQFEAAKRCIPAPILKDGRPYFKSDTSEFDESVLQGNGVSMGMANGEVFIIHNPLDRHSCQNIPNQSIVVAPILTPTLSYQLLSAGAVITEAGGFLSHGAIFAREARIPAIVGVENALQYLKSGDKVQVDAEKGVIKILEKEVR